MIKSKITRIIAFFISCILIGVFSSRVMGFVTENDYYINDYTQNPTYDVSNEMNEVYYKLWAIGTMWLRNLDEDGKFKGTKELEKQTINALRKLDCMDEYGNPTISKTKYTYDFLVSYGENKFTNTDKKYDDFKFDYYISRKNDNIDYGISGYCYGNSSFNMYDTNYGMHYYYLNGKGIALFDFDTTGLPSYIDELGATMYYKTDGTTPIPVANTSDVYYRGDDNYFNDYDEGLYEVEDIYSERTTSPTEKFQDGCYYKYEADRGRFRKVVIPTENDFTKVQVQEMALTMIIRPTDDIIQTFKEYNDYMQKREKDAVYTIVNNLPLIAVAFILALYVLILGGYDNKNKKFTMSVFDKIFAEFYVLILVAVGGFMAFTLDYSEIYLFFDDYYNKDLMLGFYKVVYPILFGMTVLAVDTLIIRVKCRSFWKTTLLWTMISIIYGWLKKLAVKVNEKIIDRDMLRHDKFTRRFILRAIIFSAIEFLFIVAFVEFNAYFALFVISTILVAGYIFLSLSDLKAICNVSRHISAINQGDYTVHDESKFSPAYCMTEKLNNISAGIQSAVDRQLKSERMKIDLVTNVSHDLKTPLTSIISYIDLLSMEELSPTAKDYVNIIVNKSQRLKTMVADLFDLAKATSRTDIDMEKIDAVILTNQVLADLSDKIDSSGKQVKTDMKSESASIMADGKKMYRVLQNMIDNALKYSLDGTRIYLTLKNELGYCIITVKNIASYEMNFAPDEIMERFTRGDESRSTDGNGLGLSIAKSFTEACGGMFKITIDGDLFIAEVKIPVITIETYKETTDITNE
ncbi:MAG: HAMP domain-containing histidine kinase [Ruminococcus sp.]|nr:HAMP domain-containing histidine kinase [Ruminococcus sp.]